MPPTPTPAPAHLLHILSAVIILDLAPSPVQALHPEQIALLHLCYLQQKPQPTEWEGKQGPLTVSPLAGRPPRACRRQCAYCGGPKRASDMLRKAPNGVTTGSIGIACLACCLFLMCSARPGRHPRGLTGGMSGCQRLCSGFSCSQAGFSGSTVIRGVGVRGAMASRSRPATTGGQDGAALSIWVELVCAAAAGWQRRLRREQGQASLATRADGVWISIDVSHVC